MQGEIQETINPQPTVDQLVSQGSDLAFLDRMALIKTRHAKLVDFIKTAGWSRLTLPELPDADMEWSSLLKIKEQVPIRRFSEQELAADPRVAAADRKHQPLPKDFHGASGDVTKVQLGAQEAAVKIAAGREGIIYLDPTLDLGLEKRALLRLSSLQGAGVVRLLGETTWLGRYGLVKDWVKGKTLGRNLIPNWGRLEGNSHPYPTPEAVESAEMLLSLFETLSQVHQRKVALGDIKLADIIWDGSYATFIDFAQAGLAEYNSTMKEWQVRSFDDNNKNFDKYIKDIELPEVLKVMFFQFTSLGGSRLSDTGVRIDEGSQGKAKSSVLGHIAGKVHRREYQTARQVKEDLFIYFVHIGMDPQQLKEPDIRVRNEDILG